MYLSITGAVLSLSLLVGASNVLDLTPANFDSVVGQGKPALVEFFAPWCGHCKNLAPIYEELADAYSYSKDVIIAKVDADAEKDLGKKYGVTGFPTLKWFTEDGKLEDYNGPRQLNDLAEFVTKKSGVRSKIKPPPPSATTQLNYLNLEETISDPTKHVLVAFTASWCGHCKAMKPAYEEVAKYFKREPNVVVANYECDSESNRPLAQKLEISSFPTIKFYPKGGNKTAVVYDGGRTAEEFVAYLNEQCGTLRAVGGGLNDQAGRVPIMDDLAHRFTTAEGSTRKEVYDAAVELADSTSEHDSVYLRVMEKMLNDSDEYLKKETKRLTSILEKRQLSEAKLDQIKIKANILSAFTDSQIVKTSEALKEGADVEVDAGAEAVNSETQRLKEEL